MSNYVCEYRELCETESSIPLFNQAWWLDVTIGEGNWDVVLVKDANKIVAALPYVILKRYKMFILSQPSISQTLGPWLLKEESNLKRYQSKYRDWMKELILKLPKFDKYSQNWSWKIESWVPFYWAGFNQTTYYTYVLENLQDENVLWKGLNDNIKSDIKKAINRFNLIVREDLSFDDFLELNKMTFQRQGIKPPYSDDYLRKIDIQCNVRNSRKILIAEDLNGNRHAGVYIVWDASTTYYLMGGGDPELRKSGATSLCLWEAIKFSSTISKYFDFEGSMIEPIEKFFKAFGGTPKPFYNVNKINSKLLKTLNFLRSIKQ